MVKVTQSALSFGAEITGRRTRRSLCRHIQK